ncbi:sensor histidine kinase [Candidatus Clostridium radicumherbarum]|uniref:histidine kinase n=1 Tax=Candidatus Clostridium radicumherbarum TaxID=3381662 RepID=A0ABW8TW55_9CLOT
MIKTLKSKFTIIYIILVIIIGAIGCFSTFNNYILGKQINGLMVRNYKSIKAINNMYQTLEEQNNAVLTYMDGNHEEGIKAFHLNEIKFYEYYNVEANNITEPGEKELVNELSLNYEKYLTYFSKLQEIDTQKGLNSAVIYNKLNINPTFETIKEILSKISMLNEEDMFSSKDKVTSYSIKSMYIFLIISTISVIIGFLLSMISIKKILKPLYSLRDTMKAVRAGDLYKQAPIISSDEVGELTIEFNNMTKRLLLFEQSTLGQLLSEKNKSITIVKSIADPLIVLDTDYRIILLNNACESVFNIKETEVINEYFFEVINNVDLYECIKSIHDSMDKDIEKKIIYFNIDSKDYYYNIIVSKLIDPSGKTTGLVVLLQNVTQLKEIEKIKSDFIATISHEFKTPLTSITIGTNLLTNELIGELNTKQKEIISTITEDSERLLSLVNNLLNLSKIESSRAIYDIKSYSVLEVIENSVKLFVDQAKNQEVFLHYDIESKLPKVNVDLEKATWVLNNLISNALRYTSLGDEIEIYAFVSQDKMCISVSDTGPGIPKDYQEKIFDKFVQVPGQDSETKGSGLGLSISKEIVESLGGEIWCESTLGLGSIFTFTIPIADFNDKKVKVLNGL